MQYRAGLKLSPVDSIQDRLMTKLLMNERHVELLKLVIHLLKDTKKAGKVPDILEEVQQRLLGREQEYFYNKAKKIMELSGVLDEASKFL